MWVKFHDHRRQGFWSGVPRAARFVLLELELLCRPGEGAVELPPGKDPISRTVEMLGGCRREARRALRFLASEACGAVLYRTPDGAHVDITSSCTGRLLVIIPTWSDDNAVGSSAQRMRDLRSKRKRFRELAQKCDASLPSHGDAHSDATEKRREEKRRAPTTLVDGAQARDSRRQQAHDRSYTEGVVCEGCDDVAQAEPGAEPKGWKDGLCVGCQDAERPASGQTAGYLAVIRQQGESEPLPARRGSHPRERSYDGGLMSPEAKQIHELLLEHRLPLNSPVGTANHIAGRLGPFGNNQLTVARVRLAIERVAAKAAAAAADGAPRSSEEIRDHLESFWRYSDARWRKLEQAVKDPEPDPEPPELELYRAPPIAPEDDPWSPENRAKRIALKLKALNERDREMAASSAAAAEEEEESLDP